MHAMLYVWRSHLKCLFLHFNLFETVSHSPLYMPDQLAPETPGIFQSPSLHRSACTTDMYGCIQLYWVQEIQIQVLTFVKQLLYPLIHLLSPQNMKNTHSRFTMRLDVIEAQEYFGCVYRFSCMANIVNLLHQATGGSNEQNQCFLVGTSSSLCGVGTEHKAEHQASTVALNLNTSPSWALSSSRDSEFSLPNKETGVQKDSVSFPKVTWFGKLQGQN